MDPPHRRSWKKRRTKPSDGSVSSQATAASMQGPRFIDSKGNVKLAKLPDHLLGKSPQQVAQALLMDPTSPEVVGIMMLSPTLKSEFAARCVGDFASKQQQTQAKTAHLEKLEVSLGVNNANTLRLHDQEANISAQLAASYHENHHLKGQKETLEQDLAAINDEWQVLQVILEVINLTDETKRSVLPFQNLPLDQVAARLGVRSWGDIALLTYNATHRATVVCNVLGLGRNALFKAKWNAPTDEARWVRLFGSEPNVLVSRKASADELKVRLAAYLSIQPPPDVIDRVMGAMGYLDDDGDSLSSIAEGEEDSSDDKAEAPIPESVDVSFKKRSRASLEEVSEEELMEELQRRKAKASSAGGDDNDDNDNNNNNNDNDDNNP